MKFTLLEALGLLASFVSAVPAVPATPNDAHLLPRLVLYYQTTHDALGRPISMLPLITEKHIALTHLLVCSFHINRGSNLTLNDYPPHFPLFSTMWEETKLMKAAGVKVMGMVGGAAAGSFDWDTLDGKTEAFEHYYAQLRDAIIQYGLEGMDIDVEQPMSQNGITRLVRRLRADFGPEFIITLAPVSTALANGGNLSGFNYKYLEQDAGQDIAFYNAQFYNGWGDLSSTAGFDRIISHNWDPTKVLAGQVTTPKNGGGFVAHSRLNQTINDLRAKYGEIGGIMGWEYFNSQPGDISQPWQWAQVMTAILRPNMVPRLTITRSTAEKLTRLWHQSGRPGTDVSLMMGPPSVDYMAMINA
ncbi:coagulation factor 5/8 type domain protein [Podospora aff. communis PSN243]|uniref:Coagulation factor 5/8 type domain protein n=1 Tax=Podospora aff. communis PSN243 TaxID=3040156 RepID=A0AAV9G7Z7_9PEZI|nr:coagulation factor 5/8 type domain protein [Podospora aff. communis PSN243]